ncbi:MAG: hypothetical protein CVU84_10800 [Firmicutes bacterium HGW-Firmicutes-1]|jgi:hypothetical protein|nr:MAG: hypothetical protein CVU84_10800 [Firmicutes bacterium HGW-Firmicutes-1]
MKFSEELIAPCGMNCGVCIAYLREKNKCCGCLSLGTNKQAHCNKCSIKFCDEHNRSEFTYCYECHKFPCSRIRKLEKRYVENYHVSLIENSTSISKYGFSEFIMNESEKWKCKNCGEVLCIHRNICLNCKEETNI